MESVNRKILFLSLLTILDISSLTLIVVFADTPIIKVESNHGPEDSNIMLSVDGEMDEAELSWYWDDILILDGFKPYQINNKSLNGFNINFNPQKNAPHNESVPHILSLSLNTRKSMMSRLRWSSMISFYSS